MLVFVLVIASADNNMDNPCQYEIGGFVADVDACLVRVEETLNDRERLVFYKSYSRN